MSFYKKLLIFAVCPILAFSMNIAFAAEPEGKPVFVKAEVEPATPIATKPAAKLAAQASTGVTKPKAEASQISIKGGGSQPIANLYVVWGKSYEVRNKGISMNYKISNVVKGIEDLEANKIAINVLDKHLGHSCSFIDMNDFNNGTIWRCQIMLQRVKSHKVKS